MSAAVPHVRVGATIIPLHPRMEVPQTPAEHPEVAKLRLALARLHGMAKGLQAGLDAETTRKVRWRTVACAEAMVIGAVVVTWMLP